MLLLHKRKSSLNLLKALAHLSMDQVKSQNLLSTWSVALQWGFVHISEESGSVGLMGGLLNL